MDMTGTPDYDLILINEAFFADSVTRSASDLLLAEGWRHFGTYYFRYNLGLHNEEIRRVVPLRVDLTQFRLSKSQRRIINKNSDLRTVVRPIEITHETNQLFERHKRRFSFGVPESIYVFLSSQPADVPCDASELAVYDSDRLVAISYFDEGDATTSGVYACFDPEMPDRGLGIYTMLQEIDYSIKTGRRYYYPGFAYEGPSFYDYKKNFYGLEAYDWRGRWHPFARGGRP
jgi:leucyl-tRNA---protein transferase